MDDEIPTNSTVGGTDGRAPQRIRDIVEGVSKSALWARLRGSDYHLLFVSDIQSQPCIKTWTSSFQPANSVLIDELKEHLIERRKVWRDMKLIAVSIENESRIAEEITQVISRLGLDAQIVYRLFDDLFFNFSIHRRPFEAPEGIVNSLDDLTIEPYAIVSAPRSGSTMLANILTKTGICGMPREHLQLDFLPLINHSIIDLARWLGTHMSVNATSNQVFGTKIISGMFERLDRTRLLKLYPTIGNLSERTKVIYLKRNDKVRQAVSHYLASQSGTHFAQTEGERQKWEIELRNMPYDPERIVRCYGWLIVQEIKLERMLRVWGGAVHQVTYEEVIQDKKKEISRIIDFLEIDAPENLAIPESDIRRMQNSRTQEIFDMFVQDYPNLRYHQPGTR